MIPPSRKSQRPAERQLSRPFKTERDVSVSQQSRNSHFARQESILRGIGFLRLGPVEGSKMLVDQFAAAVAAARSQAQLDEVSRLTWRALAEAQLSERDAEAISAAIEARRVAWKSKTPLSSSKPASAARRPPTPRSPDKAKSIERRRRWCASGAMPPQIAARFTLGEAAALAVVARQVQQHGQCRLPIDAVAALAGVCRSTVKNAIRAAAASGLVEVEERRRPGGRNLPNIISVIAPAWRSWLKLVRRWGGVKTVTATNTKDFNPPVERLGTVDDGENQRISAASSGASSHKLLYCSLVKTEDGAKGCTNTKRALSA